MQIEHMCYTNSTPAEVIYADTAVNAAIAFLQLTYPRPFPAILSVGVVQYLAAEQIEMMIVEVTAGCLGKIVQRI
jgi:hypothetical protein